MKSQLLGVVLVAVLAGYWLLRFRRWLTSTWFLVAIWRWLTGEAWHGKPVTDAGWLRRGQNALTPTGHATRWWHRPRWQRALHRTGGTAAAAGLGWAWVAHPLATSLAAAGVSLAAMAAAVVLAVRVVRRRRRQRTWLHPLHLAAHGVAGHPRALPARSWISVELDSAGAVRRATLALPQGWPAEDRDRQRLAAIASAKLGIEAPEPSWRLAGQKPQLVLAQSDPPPARVTWEDVAEAVGRAGPDELVVGIGKRGQVVKASLVSDSPHFAINMGTGGGKSTLAAFWLAQELRRGAIAMVLDAKMISHPWLFKDERGAYDQLPCVAYLSSVGQIHAGLCWLGDELDRRNQVARAAVTARGSLNGAHIGPRILIVAEELNLATPRLRAWWQEERQPGDPNKSPALTALGAVAFAGRAVKMHLILIGQMLTAEVTGQRDSSVRENVGVTAMARYGPAGWAAAVGRNVPMPPPPSVLGRVQLVTARGVQETQTPKADLLLYRQIVAESLQLAACPAGMPGLRRRVPEPARLSAGGSDVPFVSGTETPPGLPGSLVSLSEWASLPACRRSLTALRKASQRPGFPPSRGRRGLAALYDAVELAEWEQR